MAQRIPRMVVVPARGLPYAEGAAIMRSLQRATQWAAHSTAAIPEQSAGTLRLIEAYRGSALSDFHRWFYAQDHEPAPRWATTYDATPMDMLPPCVRSLLANPNSQLMEPGGLRLLVYALLALGWHPRHIAGLARSKYERNYGWGAHWYRYDAGMRADFYVRLFAGQIGTGQDTGDACNSTSTEAAGVCPVPHCGCNLTALWRSVEERKKNGTLGSRPFNRMLLPPADLGGSRAHS